MKFSAVVGNPPYQQMGGSGGSNDAPIFQLFCNIASKIQPSYISMIIPSKWFSGGRDSLLKDFRDRMLNERHLQKLVAYSNSSDIFSNVEIKGGICYFLENPKYVGDCEYSLVQDGEVKTLPLALNTFDILIRDPRLATIVKKVRDCVPAGSSFVDSIISSDTPFGIPTNPRDSRKTPIDVSDTKSEEFSVPLFFLEHGTRKYGYVRIQDVTKNKQDIPYPKVFIPKAGGSGNDSLILGQPAVALPNAVCSQTFIYAKFQLKEEATNFVTYLRTKFFRVLVSAAKITQDALSGVYRFVPIQDWSKSWSDAELYQKYHLAQDEIDYIESMIKPMGDDALFDADDYIDPQFADFSLSECGVKPGDRIVYTPTGAVLTVQADNEVEYEGETYTLARFTAKFMPRNKRSVSGVCQGPKYFTKGGTSLYLMRESFLGGKKTE